MPSVGAPRALRVMRVIARMNVGGPALQVTALMRGLDPDRFVQRLYVGRPGPDEGDYRRLRAPDVTVHEVPTLGRSIRPTDDLRTLAALTRAMREFQPDIVHTHTAKAGTLGRLAAIAAGVPARVHTFHGHLLHGYFSPARTRILTGVERTLARRTSRLVAVGGRVRDELLAAGIGRADQYAVVPPGVSLPAGPNPADARAQLGLRASPPVVAIVGRVTAIKRPDRMLAVARAVRLSIPDAQFVVCGAGDQLASTMERAGADGLAMTFLGWRADVETVYAAADVVLLTSDNEGMPVSLIEAGLAGRPAVATDVGAVAEVVRPNVTGLLTRPDADELSRAVLRLLRDDDLRGAFGRAAKAHMEAGFGRARLVGATAELYQQLAIERGWWSSRSPSLAEGR